MQIFSMEKKLMLKNYVSFHLTTHILSILISSVFKLISFTNFIGEWLK